MRYRPKRGNYPMGVYGDIDYQERLERYCTYLENKLSKLHQPDVSGCSHQQVVRCNDGYTYCQLCSKQTYP